ncbi:unnamed protein product [Ectocarpus sp. 12 AP-2014]
MCTTTTLHERSPGLRCVTDKNKTISSRRLQQKKQINMPTFRAKSVIGGKKENTNKQTHARMHACDEHNGKPLPYRTARGLQTRPDPFASTTPRTKTSTKSQSPSGLSPSPTDFTSCIPDKTSPNSRKGKTEPRRIS